MEFDYTDEQQTIQQLAEQILTAEATADQAKAVEASEAPYDEKVFRTVAEAGLLGIEIPEAFGGMGYTFGELVMLLEQVGRRVSPIPVVHNLIAASAVAEFGSDEAKQRWLPGVAGGEHILSAALTDAVSADLAAPATTAETKNGGYVLNGAKSFVPLAAESAAVLVPATLDGREAWFLVAPDAPGVKAVANARSTGMAAYDLAFDNAEVAADALLADPGTEINAFLRPRALAAVAALQVGVAAGALEMTTNYVREREQFGVPIGSFQAVQHRCADCYIDIEAMRWTMWRAAFSITAGQPADDDARIAKFWAAEGGSRVANAAMHLHGGMGADVDYPIHRYFLWSKALEHTFGAATAHLLTLGADMAAQAQSA